MNDVDEAFDGFRCNGIWDAIQSEFPLVEKRENLGEFVGWFIVNGDEGEPEPAVERADKIALKFYETTETGVPCGDS